ncbi:MAG: hypothetical protein ACJAVM_003155 [Sulfitobacter sp.]|jgi:hypothetical protein
MKFEALGIDFDQRIKCFMVNARVDYEWYLKTTQGSEENLSIQRDIIKGSKNYRTLRADLRKGCVLPAIVLAANDLDIASLFTYDNSLGFIDMREVTRQEIQASMNEVATDKIYIVDGLQRTNALRETMSELEGDELLGFLGRSLRVEIWVNIPFYSLAYRMLLLNAGQKPMSMKHQIDILSRGLREDLIGIDRIEIFTVRDHKRRVGPGQYHLSTLAQAFQAWLQKSPNVDMSNLIAERLVIDDALDSLGENLGFSQAQDGNEPFYDFINWVVDLDFRLGTEHFRFLGNDTVVLGIAAAVGFCLQNKGLTDRVKPALERLLEEATSGVQDPLGIERFDELRRSVDTKKSNVGEATRDFVFKTFREYIMQGGASSMRDCWQQSATML